MQTAICRTKQEYLDFIKKNVVTPPAHEGTWYIPGFCDLCEKQSWFMTDSPNLRERMVCEYCKLNARKRFSVKFAKDRLAEGGFRDVFVYEHKTMLWQTLKKHIDGKYAVTTSEFFGYDKKPGELVYGIRHEDAMNLSFSAESFEVLISNEVYEHVPDIRKTLREAHRVLRKGGEIWLTIPFKSLEDKTHIRAVIEDGKVTHLLPPEYHGNPVDPKNGSLVFYEYGWDFLDICKQAGFLDAYILAYHSVENGYLGANLMQFIVSK